LKQVILDEGVPRQIGRHLPGHEVTTVPARGWASFKNGALPFRIEEAGFDAFITCDKNMEFQPHQLAHSPFMILLLSTNHWPTIMPHVSTISRALEESSPGITTKVTVADFSGRSVRYPRNQTAECPALAQPC
jgi:hypothetical protein